MRLQLQLGRRLVKADPIRPSKTLLSCQILDAPLFLWVSVKQLVTTMMNFWRV